MKTGSKETKIEYKNGGIVDVYRSVDQESNDYKKRLAFCDYFAKQDEKTAITPQIHYRDPLYNEIYSSLIGTKYERTCPDMKIGNNFYEHEGFDINKNTNPTRTFSNMISRGMKQSNRIVIEDCGVTHRWAKRNIQTRINNGDIISEVWIFESNGLLTRLY